MSVDTRHTINHHEQGVFGPGRQEEIILCLPASAGSRTTPGCTFELHFLFIIIESSHVVGWVPPRVVTDCQSVTIRVQQQDTCCCQICYDWEVCEVCVRGREKEKERKGVEV